MWDPRDIDDARQRDVTKRASPFPTLEAGLRKHPHGSGRRLEIGKSREPLDPGDAVPASAARVGVEEVIGEHGGVGLVESERAQPR